MAPNLNLVPNIRNKVLVLVAALAVALGGLFEQRTKVVLADGTVITGKVLEETDTSITLERASGYKQKVDLDDIRERTWLNFEVDLNLGLDLRGGTSLRYRLDLSEVPPGERDEAVDRTVETFQSRLDSLGVKELSVYKSGEDEIIVELPGVTMEESESYEQVVESLGSLQFLIVADSRSGQVDVQAEEQRLRDHLKSLTEQGIEWTRKSVDLSQFDVPGRDGIVYRWFPYMEKAIEENPALAEFPFVMLEVNPEYKFTGEDIESLFPDVDQRGFPALGFRLKGSRAADFGEFTSANLKRRMAIVLDGEVQSAPELQGRIEDRGIISGGTNGFSEAELKNLRTTLTSGSLKVRPEKLSKATIGPTLGKAAIERGILAGIIGGTLVLLFMVLYYRTTGFIAALTLLFGLFLLLGGLGFLEATLTLPGIAGILLTVGMAVDQNILINERIREEREKGKTLAQSVKNGFERAFVTIVDAQATTFIAGFLLYHFGTGPIRGFAVTLMLGIVTTMFAALWGAKTIFAIALQREWFKEIRQAKILSDTNIEFTKYIRPCLTASAIALTGGMALFFATVEETKGLDFAGGFQAQIRVREPMARSDIEAALKPYYPNAQIVTMIMPDGRVEGEKTTDFQIKIKSTPEEREAENDQGRVGEYEATLRKALGQYLIDDGIHVDEDAIKVQDDGRSVARFRLNFTAPLPQELVENRLRAQLALRSLAPAEGQTDPARSYDVEALFNVPDLTPAAVRSAVAPAFNDLPGGVRFSEPLPASQFIGGRVGKELRNSAIKAIVLAIIAILVYIRIRFHDVNYGIAACVALVHDVLFGLGAVSLAHWLGFVDIELDLAMVGAFLTIIGYSLNDTIVIFDRVRENLPRMDRPLEEVINVSVNQTLSRTLLTSLTTLIAVVVLFALNLGQRNVLEGFCFVILVGIVVGTYSTVFIASPMLVWLTRRAEAQKAAAKTKAATA